MSKKQLDVSKITNELQGASVYFQKPSAPSPPVEKNEENTVRNSERISERTNIRTENRSDDVHSSLPKRRRSTRYSFEFYEDQILSLKDLKHRAEMNGDKLTLSDLAREAFDLYLKDKKSR